ncbi:hypothetical protein [Novosphingobium rosa]|uniref:hypothetical protein n=1 Tax=Novosphingobium rosa TaxID=76978 RepID=UPI00082B6109|nr:hypothetical protein [Novosphingobium rosa]
MKTDGIYLGASFALSGPVEKLDATRLPVRGDLAHIRLAGTVFVPHYVAPITYRSGAQGATLLKTPGGETLATLEPGAGFDVLDIAGTHAWGEVTGGGIVGYITLTQLEASV